MVKTKKGNVLLNGKKIVKEFVNTNFKEVKAKGKKGDLEFSELENEVQPENFNGTGFTSDGKRVAPVITPENNLEDAAATAPPIIREVKEEKKAENPYSATYVNYSSSKDYESSQGVETRRMAARPAGQLSRGTEIAELRPARSAWDFNQPTPLQWNETANPEELKKYRLPEDDNANRMPFEKKRRTI